MKTNYLLLAAVLLILGVWGVAQFVGADAQYYGRRGVRANFSRGDIHLHIFADATNYAAADIPLFIVNYTYGSPFVRPSLLRQTGYLGIHLPYWLAALPPAVWLAWRLYRGGPDTRGFTVAHSPSPGSMKDSSNEATSANSLRT